MKSFLKIGIVGQSGRMDKDNLTLLGHYSWRRGYLISYSLDARLSMLFGNFEYGLVDWETRNRMGKNEMAKKLQCLFSGQKANQQFHKAAKVRDLCRVREALQKPSLILRPESFYLLHRPNFCANDCSGYF